MLIYLGTGGVERLNTSCHFVLKLEGIRAQTSSNLNLWIITLQAYPSLVLHFKGTKFIVRQAFWEKSKMAHMALNFSFRTDLKFHTEGPSFSILLS